MKSRVGGKDEARAENEMEIFFIHALRTRIGGVRLFLKGIDPGDYKIGSGLG